MTRKNRVSERKLCQREMRKMEKGLEKSHKLRNHRIKNP